MDPLIERLVKQWHELDECDPYRGEIREAIDEIERLLDDNANWVRAWNKKAGELAEREAQIDSLHKTIGEMSTADNPLIVEMTQQAVEAEKAILEQVAQIAVLRSVIEKFDCLIKYQYTGSSEAMSALQDVTWLANEALSTPPQDGYLKQWLGEPVAWVCINSDGECEQIDYCTESPLPGDDGFKPLYALPGKEE